MVMDFLIYSRGTEVAADLPDDPGLDEQHWSYLDVFADGMTARGPTLRTDRQTWTGSLHIVDLPGPEAALEFVAGEPYNRAGLFERHSIWRFTNVLGQPMWQYAGAADELRFLVLAAAAEDQPTKVRPVPLVDLPQELRERLIVYGTLQDVDSGEPAGVVLALQVPSREALDVLLAEEQVGLTDYRNIEIHDWEFGGRR
jgi:uncharacterized protein YciI